MQMRWVKVIFGGLVFFRQTHVSAGTSAFSGVLAPPMRITHTSFKTSLRLFSLTLPRFKTLHFPPISLDSTRTYFTPLTSKVLTLRTQIFLPSTIVDSQTLHSGILPLELLSPAAAFELAKNSPSFLVMTTGLPGVATTPTSFSIRTVVSIPSFVNITRPWSPISPNLSVVPIIKTFLTMFAAQSAQSRLPRIPSSRCFPIFSAAFNPLHFATLQSSAGRTTLVSLNPLRPISAHSQIHGLLTLSHKPVTRKHSHLIPIQMQGQPPPNHSQSYRSPLHRL